MTETEKREIVQKFTTGLRNEDGRAPALPQPVTCAQPPRLPERRIRGTSSPGRRAPSCMRTPRPSRTPRNGSHDVHNGVVRVLVGPIALPLEHHRERGHRFSTSLDHALHRVLVGQLAHVAAGSAPSRVFPHASRQKPKACFPCHARLGCASREKAVATPGTTKHVVSKVA